MDHIKEYLEYKAYQLRVAALRMTTRAGSGHPTSCLSAADLVAALFFYAMQYDPRNLDNANNDRFVLSKGHAAPLLYAAWKEVGVLTEKDLEGYRELQSPLEGHPTSRFSYAEAATGSLGMGLSIGVGMGIFANMHHLAYTTYVLLGDGEVAEGQIWEAAELAAYYKLGNLVGILDCNRLGQSGETMHAHHAHRYEEKFKAFGWHTITIDGHDMSEIMHALDKAQAHIDLPVMIIAKTFKGYGVSLFENKEYFHGKPLKKDQLPQALEQLRENFPQAASYDVAAYNWQPTLPEHNLELEKDCIGVDINYPQFALGEMMATREAYGKGLVALGHACNAVVALDGDVKNSTYAELFAEKFPERFVECFIAEQNMVSVAVGMQKRGAVPYVATFAAFFSRAHDQIRMAAIGNAQLRLVGSHAGVSIGQDGPSQMGLEDIALMRSVPNSAVLYPCDAVSTVKLVGAMSEYNQGISYLRTTRMATPVIYESHEQFPIGGCKVLRSSDADVACVVAAGVTVHEALKAYEQLRARGVMIAVVDLYSIKPLDAATIKKIAAQSGNLITVEDHYLEGGLGQAVSCALRNELFTIQALAVRELPRSGSPEELMAAAGIDAAAISKAVDSLCK